MAYFFVLSVWHMASSVIKLSPIVPPLFLLSNTKFNRDFREMRIITADVADLNFSYSQNSLFLDWRLIWHLLILLLNKSNPNECLNKCTTSFLINHSAHLFTLTVISKQFSYLESSWRLCLQNMCYAKESSKRTYVKIKNVLMTHFLMFVQRQRNYLVNTLKTKYNFVFSMNGTDYSEFEKY